MTAKPVLIQGGREALFDDSQIGAGALAQVLISTDRKYVFKMESSKGKDELQTLRELILKSQLKPESRKLLVKALSVENHPFVQWQDAKVHVQECAPGNDLRSYNAKGALSFEDRLHIAIQTASLFKEINEAGAAYLDHKPNEHIYWDADNRVIKVIDWNAAVIEAAEAEREQDFVNYCLALHEILDTNPYPYGESGGRTKIYRYLTNPLNWSLDKESLKHHESLGYRSWFILALTSLTVGGKPFLQDWAELLRVFADIQDGKNLWLESIVSKYDSDSDLKKACDLIGQMLLLDFPTSEQRKEASVLTEKWAQEIRFVQEAGEIKESAYQEIMDQLLFARLLSPSRFQTFCQFEVWRLFFANPAKIDLRKLFIDLKPTLAWESYIKSIEECPDFSKLTTLENLKKKAKAQEAVEKANKLISENKLSDAMGLLREAETLDPDNLDVQITHNNIKGSDQIQSLSEEILRSAKSVLETGDWEGALSKVNDVRKMWQDAKMPEHIKAQAQSLLEQIEVTRKTKDEQSDTVRRLRIILNQNPDEQTSMQLDEFIANISDQIMTPEQRNLFEEVRERRRNVENREKQWISVNSAENFETWQNGLAEAAANGNQRAKEDLSDADLIGKVLKKIQQGIKQTSSLDLETSARSYLDAQKQILKWREKLQGKETPLKFLGQVEGELPALKDAILQRAEENIRALLVRQERVEADLGNANNILKVVSVFGEQEFKTREMAGWLAHCRLIEEMKGDLNKWEQLSDEIVKLPSEIFNGAYYADLRQWIQDMKRNNRLVEWTPRQWEDDIQLLKERFEKGKQSGVVESELYRKLVEAEQKAGLDAAERNKIDALQQAFDTKLSESKKALKSDMEALQTQLKFLLSETQFQTSLNKSSDALQNAQKENVEGVRKYIETVSVDLGKRFEASKDTLQEIRLGNQNLANSLKNLVTQDQLNANIKMISDSLRSLSEKTDGVFNAQRETAKEIIALEKKINSIQAGSVGSVRAHADSRQEKTPQKEEKPANLPTGEGYQEFPSNTRKNMKNTWKKFVAFVQKQIILVSIIGVAGCLIITATIFGIYYMQPSTFPVAFNPTETPTPTATVTPNPTSTLTPTATPVPGILLNSVNSIQISTSDDNKRTIITLSPGAGAIELTKQEQFTNGNVKITFIAALKKDVISDSAKAVAGGEYTISTDKEGKLELYCLFLTDKATPALCGEYNFDKTKPDKFKVAQDTNLPQEYVWLEWIGIVSESAIQK